jgi:hypothetical protein
MRPALIFRYVSVLISGEQTIHDTFLYTFMISLPHIYTLIFLVSLTVVITFLGTVTTQSNTTRSNTTRSNTTRSNTTRSNTTCSNATRSNKTRSNTTRSNTTRT